MLKQVSELANKWHAQLLQILELKWFVWKSHVKGIWVQVSPLGLLIWWTFGWKKIPKKFQQNHSYQTKGNHLFFISLISRFREASSAICWPFPPIPGELRTTPGGNCPRMYCCCAAGIVYIVPVLLTWTCYRNKWKKCKTVKVSNPSKCPIPWEPILSQQHTWQFYSLSAHKITRCVATFSFHSMKWQGNTSTPSWMECQSISGCPSPPLPQHFVWLPW